MLLTNPLRILGLVSEVSKSACNCSMLTFYRRFRGAGGHKEGLSSWCSKKYASAKKIFREQQEWFDVGPLWPIGQ